MTYQVAEPRRGRGLWRLPVLALGMIVTFWGLAESVANLTAWGYLLPIDKPWVSAIPCVACAIGPLIVIAALPWGRANRPPTEA